MCFLSLFNLKLLSIQIWNCDRIDKMFKSFKITLSFSLFLTVYVIYRVGKNAVTKSRAAILLFFLASLVKHILRGSLGLPQMGENKFMEDKWKTPNMLHVIIPQFSGDILFPFFLCLVLHKIKYFALCKRIVDNMCIVQYIEIVRRSVF